MNLLKELKKSVVAALPKIVVWEYCIGYGFVDRRIFRLKDCETFGRAPHIFCHLTFPLSLNLGWVRCVVASDVFEIVRPPPSLMGTALKNQLQKWNCNCNCPKKPLHFWGCWQDETGELNERRKIFKLLKTQAQKNANFAMAIISQGKKRTTSEARKQQDFSGFQKKSTFCDREFHPSSRQSLYLFKYSDIEVLLEKQFSFMFKRQYFVVSFFFLAVLVHLKL